VHVLIKRKSNLASNYPKANSLHKDYSYNSQLNLERMQEAINYNRYQRDFIVKEINKIDKKTKKILDFGAGIGTYADMLREMGFSVDCVEIDVHERKILDKKGYKLYSNLDEIKGKYDIIYSLNVLEHIENDTELTRKLKSCLDEDGTLLIFVPAFNLIFTKLDVIADHFRRYRIKDMRRLASDTGLNANAHYCDPIGFIGALIYKALNMNGSLTPRSIYVFDRFLFPVSMFLEPLTNKLFGKNILCKFTK
jgi:2-polyprenyl-3-methyl-5-hydroxy-6-metoxy-1,4-benzoquinol methylase